MAYTTKAQVRIIQFGTGNFLRGFIGPMLQRWQDQEGANVETLVVKPTASYTESFQAWVEQGGKYHVLIKGQQNGQIVDELQVIDHVATICHPYRNYADFLSLAQTDAQFIVSNTTEAGLSFLPSDALSDTPAASFPGKLTQLLHARWTYTEGAEDRGYDILPCELLEKNGDLLKELVLRYCTHWELPTAFTNWVSKANQFYNTLVDRIVPGKPTLDEELQERLHFSDVNVVQAEPYLLWAIESTDNLATRLPLSELGLNVVFTPDIKRYKTLKVSILNGAHTAMTMWGLHYGIVTVGEFMQNSAARLYLDQLLVESILPTLPYPSAEKTAYQQAVYDRFENPFIHHRLHDISLNSVAKFNSRLLPTLLAYHEQFNTLPSQIVFALALLIRNYRGDCYPLRDEPDVIETLTQHWSAFANHGAVQTLVAAILADESLWNENLVTRLPGLVDQCTIQLNELLSRKMNA